MRRLHIIMPMGGLGSRFAAEGFAEPKPLIAVGGLPMFQKSLSSFDGYEGPQTVTAVIRREHDEKFQLATRLRQARPSMRVVVIEALTRGAVETCLAAEPVIDAKDAIAVLDCDLWFESAAYKDLLRACLADKKNLAGGLLTFESDNPRYSFAETDGRRVLRTAEKIAISTHAIAGAYFFSHAGDFFAAARTLMARPVPGEYYTSMLYNILISSGGAVEAVPAQRFASFGTPEELAAFQAAAENLSDPA